MGKSIKYRGEGIELQNPNEWFMQVPTVEYKSGTPGDARSIQVVEIGFKWRKDQVGDTEKRFTPYSENKRYM